MKANAPERLYLSKNIYSTYLYQVPDPDDETAVEYIRADAFIEKAERYIRSVADGLDRDDDVEVFISEFVNYMKEE